MTSAPWEAEVQRVIEQRYREKYGNISVAFDVLDPLDEHTAHVRFTLSDRHGFITRYYGTASYQTGQLHLKVKAI